MSEQPPVPAPEACCAPLVRSPIPAPDAVAPARAFKAIGDPVRLRLLSMIASHGSGEICVCDLTPAFELSGPTISHHLRVLREAGLIDHDRRGTWVYYRAVPERLAALSRLLRTPVGAPEGSTGPAGSTRDEPRPDTVT